MASAKDKLKEYFLQHVGEIISRDVLREVSGNVLDWQRSLKQLRQETGLDIKSEPEGYILTSKEPVNTPKTRGYISDKLRYAVLQRDNSTCQRCGANITNLPGVKLRVDHKIPVDLGGETTIDNLWTLCDKCNGGKKSFFDDSEADTIREISKLNSAQKRIKAYFAEKPNQVISPTKLSMIAKVRDWERVLRKVRREENMNIEWIRPNSDYPEGGYIYKK